ncbi:hypothetical protein [Bifidobacterium longum]|uniref:hypothetical protein n=1 Tax=Bifidobacterium longum TaxID=216816 RepID=UPI002073A720|nr:hypothetical protein [Bifidobacterium longum]MDW3164666.1 hypothetical protein [Bifidobacterium longum]
MASVKEEGTMNTQRSNTGPLVARIVKTVVSVVLAAVIIVAMVLINPQLSANKLISSLMGYNHQSVNNNGITADGVDANYYTADYTKDNIRAAEDDLYNDNARDFAHFGLGLR